MPTRWVKKGGKLELKEITWNRILFGTRKDPGEAWVVGATLYTIAYDKSTVNLVQKSGHKVLLAPEAIERFWSISVGKHGGISCYLLVKTEDHYYESFIVRKRDHICEDDAKLLNAYYGKR